MILGAIDIGSNAARLLIQEAVETAENGVQFRNLRLDRVPVRLGFDVFETGQISDERAQVLIGAMEQFKSLFHQFEVSHFRAVATSAMRDARNAADLVGTVQRQTGINIEVISGDREAAIIFENHDFKDQSDQSSYLYIDVGGGSTELTLFEGSKLKCRRSFNIGTIRLLKDQIQPASWQELHLFIDQEIPPHGAVVAIGTGGNINQAFQLASTGEGLALSPEILQRLYSQLAAITVEERMERHRLAADRADVIVPALEIFLNVMQWAGITSIRAQKAGLADGLIRTLYKELTLRGN